MLRDDPPAGTKVKFLTEVRKAQKGDTGTLVRPRGTYFTENAGDQFDVMFRGELITVQRREIEEAE